MTTILRGANKRGIDKFLQVLQDWVFPNINDAERERIMQHIEWMRAQQGDMSVNCRLETFEDRLTTRILLEASFKQLPPWKQQ